MPCAAGNRWQGRQRSAGGGGNDGDNEEGAGGGGSGGTVYLVAATLHIEGAITATGGFVVGGTTSITMEVRTGNAATTGGRGLSAASASTTPQTPSSAAPSHRRPATSI